MPYLGARPTDVFADRDLNGQEFILDADADTSITADTDDQIDIRIAGADDFQFTANTFTVLSGSTLAVASGATIANSGTATGFGVSLANDGDNRIVTADGSGGLNGEANLVFDGSLMFLNDSANGNMTDGLTINQTGADNEIFALKCSDVAHGITATTETDTYTTFTKVSAAEGGLYLQSFAEHHRGFLLRSFCTSEITSDTSSSRANIAFNGVLKDGSSWTDQTSSGNVAAFENNGTTRWLIKGNGDVHQTTDAHTALDAFSDSEVCRVFDMEYANPASIIKSKWDDFINKESRQDQLIAAGLISKMSPEDEANGARPLFNASQLQRLHNGAIWQQHEKHHNLLNAVYELAAEAVGKERADEILDNNDVKLLSKSILLN